MHETILRGNQRFAQVSARGDVSPGPDHLDRIACLVAHQLQFVADPAVVTVLLAEAILVGDVPLLEQAQAQGLLVSFRAKIKVP